MGPVLVWGGAAIWLYAKDQTGWAIFMVIYGVAVISSVDNFVKPILMSRAGGLSMLLVVLGVFGGAIAFGFIGLVRRSGAARRVAGSSRMRGCWAGRPQPAASPRTPAMKARIKLVEGMTFVAESGSGHAVVVDAAPDVGGRNLGARPMELVLMGTGACSRHRRGAHPAQGAAAGHGLRGRARGRARREGSEGLHAHRPCATS